ncbi:MAG: hypothetical protein Q4D59_08715 [Erysipelotrichaceae bacterium]|jgi:DNA helicase TIP49 (TBP-interacting protein)|nr:hypothetical protein [Erysipelotrichaceae bacterium]MDO5109996.1 hypothetical protein [Erysipelotrichaceae bacterium]
MPNIYPYNYWILYAAIAVLVITLIVSLVKIAGMAKEMIAFITPRTEMLQRKATLTQIKLDAMAEKKAEDAKKNKVLKMVMPILLAIYSIYRKDDEASGPSGYVKAAKTYFNDRSEEQKFIKKIRAAIR